MDRRMVNKQNIWFKLLVVLFVFCISVSVPICTEKEENILTAYAAGSISINKTSVTLYKGNTTRLKLNGTSKKVVWSSSNKKVATVTAKGTVKGISKGSCTITAKVGEKKYTCEVTVLNQNISEKNLIMLTGDQHKLNIKGAVSEVTWKSEDNSIATVDNDGNINAIKEGTVKIYGKYNKKSYACNVTIIKKRMEATTKKITCFYDSSILITVSDLQEDENLSCTISDQTIADVRWGEWNGEEIELTVVPKGTGSTKLDITSNYSKQELVIEVNVIDPDKSEEKEKILTPKEIYKKCAPGTVQINTDNGLGSGFFISEDMVVTNFHVIDGASQIAIKTYDGKEYAVSKIMGYDPDLDIAILSSDAKITPIEMNTHGVVIGEDTYAIGSSLGLTDTFSNGMVTNNKRVMDDIYYIQTNTPISRGNSGGPLLNAYGEVIGINTFYFIEGQNLNMAIEINQIYKVGTSNPLTMEEFIKKQEAERYVYEDISISQSSKKVQIIEVGDILSGEITIDQNPKVDGYMIDIENTGSYSISFQATENHENILFALYSSYDTDKPIGYISLDNRNIAVVKDIPLTYGSYYIIIAADDEIVQEKNIGYMVCIESE